MSNLFDHTPVVSETLYGPSIHDDGIAMDNQSFRLAGLVDTRWAGMGLRLSVDARQVVSDVLVALADVAVERPAEFGELLISLAEHTSFLRELDHGRVAVTDSRGSAEQISENRDEIVDDLLTLAEVDGLVATAEVPGPLAAEFVMRAMNEVPSEVYESRVRINVARLKRKESADA